jgi:hypothetical protein
MDLHQKTKLKLPQLESLIKVFFFLNQTLSVILFFKFAA